MRTSKKCLSYDDDSNISEGISNTFYQFWSRGRGGVKVVTSTTFSGVTIIYMIGEGQGRTPKKKEKEKRKETKEKEKKRERKRKENIQ